MLDILAILVGLEYFAGARTFISGTVFCYTIWFVVNIFDTLVIDLGVMVHWKKCRLPGTENMDEEYKLLNKKSIMDGLYGYIIGIPIAFLSGLVILLICK